MWWVPECIVTHPHAYVLNRTRSRPRTIRPFPVKSLFVSFWRRPQSQSSAVRYTSFHWHGFSSPRRVNVCCHCSQGLNFSGADLSRLDLRYINFKMANLSRCNLTHANLCCSNLERADLSGANLDVSLFLSGLTASCDRISRRVVSALAVSPRGSEHFLLLSVSFLCYVGCPRPSCWWTMDFWFVATCHLLPCQLCGRKERSVLKHTPSRLPTSLPQSGDLTFPITRCDHERILIWCFEGC